jgi:Bacterial Ig domain
MLLRYRKARTGKLSGTVVVLAWFFLQTLPAAARWRPVRISSPPRHSTVSGPVLIAVETLDEDVEWIDLWVDDDYLGSSPPYTMTWDSTRYAGGKHRITAVAHGPEEAVLGSVSTWVEVANPAVSIIVPATGGIVAGTINVVTKVAKEVDWINLYIDGNYVNSPDYNFSLDTAAFSDGSHKLSIDALRNPDEYLGTASLVVDFANNSPTRVLVAGGYWSGVVASTETYDPVTRTFGPSANMETPRTNHSATRLLNGQVLIAGGIIDTQDGVTGSAELYDAGSGTLQATGDMGDSRVDHTATLLANGMVLMAGGSNGSLNVIARAQTYDPSTGVFSATADMNMPRMEHAAALLPNHEVLVTGGMDDRFVTLDSAETYDPGSGLFTAIGDMLKARIGHTMTVLPNTKVLITGGAGNFAELFDPGLNQFSPTGTMTVARQFHTATLLPNGKVLIAGGVDSGYARISTAELYDPDGGSFVPTGGMAVARAGHTAELLADGTVLIVGGGDLNAEIYDPASGTFSPAGSLSSPRAGGQSATLMH